LKIACVLITHLPAKAELKRRPDLRGKPVIIYQGHGSNWVVLDRTPEAKGVKAGMTLQKAVSRVKNAEQLQANNAFYQGVFDEMVDALSQHSYRIEKAGLGCVYVRLDGLERMYGGEDRLITALLDAVPAEFSPRVGVASGKFPAYAAAVSTPGGQVTRVPADVAGFLRDFSISLLPLSLEDQTRLHEFGFRKLGQLAGIAPGPVQAQFGLAGKIAWDLANGSDPSPLIPDRREETVSEFLTFPSPTITRNAIATAAEALLRRAFARKETRGRYVRTATLESEIYRRPPWIKEFVFKEPAGSWDRAFPVINYSLESVTLEGPLEDMKLTLAGLTGETGRQGSLLTEVRQHDQLREMVRQMEALGNRVSPLYQIRNLEPWSRIPERRQAMIRFDP
jgi:nucleotidyltransferase/DNA polymerase involved in DNA repair